ncbi:hypothetical protein FB45DRAFT_912775 [Roridomyces roridus]|uniref:Methyltransferase-domain-containing protein n=1 Tax=Roridomyces roridus TaxID=1738132 RepID=A0AAD7BWC4_9AGAR|nr:hypothetical protein FB45DRAFT_912775 [Roridomyces roridus]
MTSGCTEPMHVGGIGLIPLSLAHLGCNVITSDLPSVISACLGDNIEQNLSLLPPTAGQISVRELDWTIPPQLWAWDNDTVIASPTHTPSAGQQQPTFDLVVSSDTIYSSDLIEPFLRTLHALCTAASGARAPVALICLERRDPALIDETLDKAKERGFTVTRVPPHKVSKALRKSGAQWEKADWEGVELWKLVLK